MKFLVRLRIEEVEGLEWPQVGVEAEDRWGALVAAAESLGLTGMFPMRFFWKKSSVIKQEGRIARRYRIPPAKVENLIKTERRPWWKLF